MFPDPVAETKIIQFAVDSHFLLYAGWLRPQWCNGFRFRAEKK
jgi:hypothetical protein